MNTCEFLRKKSGINNQPGRHSMQLTSQIRHMQYLIQLYALSKRNIILRYKHSLLGFLWGFLKPLLYLLIFTVIFSSQFSSVSHYVLYATSGIIFWFFFSNITAQSMQSIIQSSGIIKSIKVPAILFPLSECLSEFFNLIPALIVYFFLMHWFGMQYSLSLFWLFPAILLFGLFSLSVGLLLSALNVYFRDTAILWNTIQPAIFYLTPIAYTESLIPTKFSFVIRYNPVYFFIRLIRKPIYESASPAWNDWLYCILIAMAAFSFSYLVFHRLKNQFITAI